MNGHNKLTLIGNLIADPVKKTYGAGKTLAEVTIAVNSGSKDKKASYIKCTMFAGLGDVADKYLKKGASVLIDGRIRVNQYVNKNGEKRQAAELIVNDMTMLGDHSNAGENTAMLAGNLVANPEVTTLNSGLTKAKFRLAINNGRNKTAPADYIDVVFFDKIAENVQKLLTKGKSVYVIGRLDTRTYEKKDGTKGDAIEIIGQRFQILGNKNGNKAPVAVNAVDTTEELDEIIPF